jgi:hypothetical protein
MDHQIPFSHFGYLRVPVVSTNPYKFVAKLKAIANFICVDGVEGGVAPCVGVKPPHPRTSLK